MLIEDALLAALQADKEARVRTGATGMHAYASEAGGCARKMSYDMMAGRPPWTPNLTQSVAFRIGKDLEMAILDAAEAMNPTVRRQVPWTLNSKTITNVTGGVADGVYIQGPPDVISAQGIMALWEDTATPFVGPPEGATVVMEVKSMAHVYFSKAQKYGPEQGHVLQASLGAIALGAEWIHIVYISKGAKQSESPILEFVQPVDREQVALALAEQEIAVAAARAGVPADPWQMGDLIGRPMPKRPPCLWCGWVSRCEADPVDPAVSTEARISGAVNKYTRTRPEFYDSGEAGEVPRSN